MDEAATQRRAEAAISYMKAVRFRQNAFMIIDKMVELSPEHPSELVDEFLHSIFFLGEINNPQYAPNDIVSDGDMLDALRTRYPQRFEPSSQLPRRCPFSCVLDVIVLQTRQENENEIKQKLQELVLQLEKDGSNNLVSSTICVSQNTAIPNSARYYGVSMSTSGLNPGRIMIAASCLSTWWDGYVADAVMTYYPSKKRKKTYFDGTIRLPENVRCEAFNIRDREPKPPCRSCANLFGLTTEETQVWPHGNCAEAESVSNLLKNEREIREEARPTSRTYTVKNRKRAREDVLAVLRGYLREVKFSWVE